MKCKEIKDLILEYADGSLDQTEKLRVESHLRECDECGLLFRQSDEVWNLLDKWDGIEPQEDIVARFWQRVSEEDARRKGVFDFFKSLNLRWAVGVAVAIILTLSVISFNVFQPDRANVVFTEEDEADEELLIKLDKAVSRETAESLDIYGPWEEGIEENNKGG